MDNHSGYRLLLVALIILLNAFFAGAEVALLSTRRSRLRHLAEGGNVGAQAAISLRESGPSVVGDTGRCNAGKSRIGLGG